jgi:N-acetyl-1-D-myo-inositol-2-amino-2-deoxy-alpha-D-glucopyranoside deacetylase
VTVLDDAQTVLFAHAHPDDETLSSGGLIAMLAARGARVAVVTGSRGERGEAVPGPLKSLEGTPLLAAHRETELARALAVLGVAQHLYLGEPGALADGRAARRYTDSGMVWGPDGRAAPVPDAAEHALTSAPLEEVAADLEAAIRTVGPDLIVSYDGDGGYGHPDHLRMHDATTLAAARAGVPFVAILDADEPGATRIELGGFLAVKRAALAEHASQLTVVDDGVVHSGGQHQAIGGTEFYRLG